MLNGETPDAIRVKRTYKIRPDQDMALELALHRLRIGDGTGLPDDGIPDNRSRIIEALLDAAGFNQSFLDGEAALDM